MNTVVIVSGEQQRDSAMHIHVSILLQTPLLSRLPHNIEQSALCYGRSLLFIHFKYSRTYMLIPNSLAIPYLHSLSPATRSWFSASLLLFLVTLCSTFGISVPHPGDRTCVPCGES